MTLAENISLPLEVHSSMSRARINLVGITGLQYVGLDFYNPMEFPVPQREGVGEYSVVPTLHSGMSELVATLSKIANNVSTPVSGSRLRAFVRCGE